MNPEQELRRRLIEYIGANTLQLLELSVTLAITQAELQGLRSEKASVETIKKNAHRREPR
jgi:hypothetical protein